MIYNIEIIIQRVEGAIIRTLGLIERRGFTVSALSTNDSACEEEMAMVLTVESQERSVEVLTKQIERLFDVREVTLRPTPGELPLQEQVACSM